MSATHKKTKNFNPITAEKQERKMRLLRDFYLSGLHLLGISLRSIRNFLHIISFMVRTKYRAGNTIKSKMRLCKRFVSVIFTGSSRMSGDNKLNAENMCRKVRGEIKTFTTADVDTGDETRCRGLSVAPECPVAVCDKFWIERIMITLFMPL
jgi:hypothetical protein